MQNQFLITIDNKVTNDFVINFFKSINFIKSVKKQTNLDKSKINVDEITLMSEQSLAKDWLTPEEEEAWKNL